MESDKDKDNKNLQTEYSAICDNLNQLASFRFTLIGFYVAAIGLIVSSNVCESNFFLMLWISICFWIIELRNRGLHTNMAERGKTIEIEFWGYEGFISNWSKKKDRKNLDKVKTIFGKYPLPDFLSHSIGLDLLFIGVITYSIIKLLIL